MKLIYMHRKSTNNPGLLLSLPHVWVFPVRTHQNRSQTEAGCLPKCDTRDTDKTGLGWTAAGVPCVLCLSWEEKFANGTDTGSRQWETCSWPEINTVSGTISPTTYTATPGQHKLHTLSETWCCLKASSVMPGLVEGLLGSLRHASSKILTRWEILFSSRANLLENKAFSLHMVLKGSVNDAGTRWQIMYRDATQQQQQHK